MNNSTIDFYLRIADRQICIDCNEKIAGRPFTQTKKGFLHLACMFEVLPRERKKPKKRKKK